jgi:hypothetical protein
MSKYRSLPLIGWKKRGLKGKRTAKQPENNTGADPRAATIRNHSLGPGYPFVLINHDFQLLR